MLLGDLSYISSHTINRQAGSQAGGLHSSHLFDWLLQGKEQGDSMAANTWQQSLWVLQGVNHTWSGIIIITTCVAYTLYCRLGRAAVETAIRLLFVVLLANLTTGSKYSSTESFVVKLLLQLMSLLP